MKVTQWSRVCLPILSLLFIGSAFSQDTLRIGSGLLHGAVPFLGTSTIESFRIQGGVRTPISRTILSIDEVIEEGLPIFSVSIAHVAAGRGDSAFTTIDLQRENFALLRHKVKASHDSAVVVYSRGFITGWVVLPDQPIQLIDTRTAHQVFPVDGPAPWFITALPLKEGLRLVLPRYSMWENSIQYEELNVIGTELLENNGKKVECWKIDNGPFAIPGYRAFSWVDKKTKQILQTHLKGKVDQIEYWSITDY